MSHAISIYDVDFSISPQTTDVTVFGNVLAPSTEINEAITFTAEGDVASALRFEWDFGDGVKGYGSPVTHTFIIPNPHLRVILRMITDDGQQTVMSKPLYLFDPDENTVPRLELIEAEEGLTYGSDSYSTGTYGG